MAAGEDKQENFVFSKTENESGEMRTKEKKKGKYRMKVFNYMNIPTSMMQPVKRRHGEKLQSLKAQSVELN